MAANNMNRVSGGVVLTLVISLLLSVSAARADSASAASLCKVGDRYLSQGDYGKAVKAFEQAVRIDPDVAAGYAGLGRGYLKLGANEVMSNPALLEKGVAAFNAALRLSPGLADVRRDLGLTWLALGNRDQALREQKLLEKEAPQVARELAAAIAGFRSSPAYRELGAGGATEGNLTAVDIKGNTVLVPVTLAIAGQTAQASLVLDTGASMTTITPGLAARLGIRLDQAPVGRMQVADGRMVEARAVRLDRVTAGPHSKAGMVVVVVEQRGAELQFDGLLGMDFLRDLHYRVDFKHKVINWAP